MTIRLYFNKQSCTNPAPRWALHVAEDNSVYFVDRVESVGADHETEQAPQLPNLKADWVLKYTNVELALQFGTAYISRKAK